MAQTLHGGSTCPGNGQTVTVETGNHTVSLAVAGTGAVRFKAQLWRKESGCTGGPVGAPITASGTTTATATFDFSANRSELWAQLIEVSDASTFTASVADAEA